MRRTSRGLIALYDFNSSKGKVVKDRSGVGQAVDLKIVRMNGVRRSEGSLEVIGDTLIRSDAPATKIIGAVRRTGEIAIEAWIQPANTEQKGPARIITLSLNSGKRNFTLGQDADRFEVRFRTTKTNANGLPALHSATNTSTTQLTHVVYTRNNKGQARIYINGRESERRTVPGASENWSDSFKLALGNEHTNDRLWLGKYYLVAIYNRDLSAREVSQHFQAGHRANASPRWLASEQTEPRRQHFETKVAPLLAQNCLDCHNTSAKKGRLDLSRKVAALKGGESGQVIVPGQANKSLLWDQVESGDMPPEGPPLSETDKAVLRQWIDDGAVWSIDVIDPAIYTHGSRAADIWVQRLTISEYIETVRSAVGVDIAKEARKILPPDLRADGFSNTAYNLTVDLKHVEAYSRLAETIVERTDVLKFAARFSKSQLLSTDATMRKLVAAMGKWLLRGPLDEREEINYSGIATTVASAGGDFEEAVRLVIKAMLQSPRFIYRVEEQLGDTATWPVGEYELASRLSYIIWGGPPDRELIRAVEAGEFHDPRLIEEQVHRMLQDPRAVERSSQFISEWLDLDRLQHLQPGRKRFPKWDGALGADMREETLAFFKDLVWKQNRPLADLLNAQFTYATPRLAEHYGLTPQGSGLSRYDLSSVPARGGLLTHGSVLTVGGDDASMVTRGLFVLHDLLRGVVKDPPPGLDTTPVPAEPGLSRRRIAQQRIDNVSCGGCHAKFEPLAFGLERFDGVGAYHDKDEHGNQLRADGEILFPGTANPAPYESTAELMDLLAGSDRVSETITWKLTQFALGRPLAAADARVMNKIHRTAQKGGGTYTELITAIVMSDLVQMTRHDRE